MLEFYQHIFFKHFHLQIKTVKITFIQIIPNEKVIFYFIALILSHKDLLSIEQIESFIFPHTHLYIVTLSSSIQRSTILGNISLSYHLNGKFANMRNVYSWI